MGKSATLFKSVPDDSCNLFADHRPKVEAIGKILEFQRKDISDATKIPLESVRLNRPTQELEERVREWAIAINLVAAHFQDVDKAILWFRTSNPLLGGIAPRDMIRFGRFKKLLAFIHSALEENKPDVKTKKGK